MLKQTPRGPLGSAHAGGLSKLRHLVANTCCAQRSPTIRNRGQPAGAIEIYFIKRPYLNQRGNSIVSREIVIYSFSIEQVFFSFTSGYYKQFANFRSAAITDGAFVGKTFPRNKMALFHQFKFFIGRSCLRFSTFFNFHRSLKKLLTAKVGRGSRRVTRYRVIAEPVQTS